VENVGVICLRSYFRADCRSISRTGRGGLADVGEMKRAIANEQRERQTTDRYASTLVIASAIIAAIRLGREDISTPSPRLTSVIGDSVTLARTILRRVTGQ
jgi:hypothetical protein